MKEKKFLMDLDLDSRDYKFNSNQNNVSNQIIESMSQVRIKVHI